MWDGRARPSTEGDEEQQFEVVVESMASEVRLHLLTMGLRQVINPFVPAFPRHRMEIIVTCSS